MDLLLPGAMNRIIGGSQRQLPPELLCVLEGLWGEKARGFFLLLSKYSLLVYSCTEKKARSHTPQEKGIGSIITSMYARNKSYFHAGYKNVQHAIINKKLLDICFNLLKEILVVITRQILEN